MQNEPLKLCDLQEWEAKTRMLYAARSTKAGTSLKLYVTLTGKYQVEFGGTIVLESTYAAIALDAFNTRAHE